MSTNANSPGNSRGYGQGNGQGKSQIQTGPTESMLKKPPTAGQRFKATMAKLVPDRRVWTDLGFTVVFVSLALIGFRTTFFGMGWLWVGLGGMAMGLLMSHIAVTYKWPSIFGALLVVATYLLFAPMIAVREDLIAGFIPGGSAFGTVIHQAWAGWKELLMALPPVDSEGPYMALPFLFGLVGAALTYAIARTWPAPAVALLAPAALLITSILLGTLTPASVALQGAAFGLVAIAWAAIRAGRRRPALQNGAGRTTRLVTTVVLLALATVGGYFVGPLLPGANPDARTVLRTGMQPPFDVSQYPSPLSGFRQYTEPNPAEKYNKTLMRVEGLPKGVPLRFAALDSYDGLAWGAANKANSGAGETGASFRKVGSHISGGTSGVGAKETTARITITADGYSDVWLPTFGNVTGLSFGGPRADQLKDQLRFNVDTSTGVLQSRLQAGDQLEVSAMAAPVGDSLPQAQSLASGSLLDAGQLSFLESKLDAWTGNVDGTWEQIVAITRQLRSGAYTDGGDASSPQEALFLPGHSIRRMSTFMSNPQLAGNDEQYASALAMAVNRLGVPSRVVLGATPDENGYVKGKDVHAWVEVKLDSGAWLPIMSSQFVPSRDRKPAPLKPKTQEQKAGAQVPPPAANNPPSVLQGPDQAQNATELRKPPVSDKNPFNPDNWPDWLRYLVFFVGVPLLLFGIVYGSIRFAKWLRRRRRRTKGETDLRVSGGWREITDQARDLKMPLPVRGTRHEQAQSLEDHVNGPAPVKPSPIIDGAVMGAPVPALAPVAPAPLGVALVPLASAADGHVFAHDRPDQAEVDAYWADVATARKSLREKSSWWQLLRGDLSLRTFREVKDGSDETGKGRGRKGRRSTHIMRSDREALRRVELAHSGTKVTSRGARHRKPKSRSLKRNSRK